MPKKVLILTLILLLTLGFSAFGAEKSAKAVDEIMLKRLKSMENQDYPDESVVSTHVTAPVVPKLLGPMPSNVAGFTYYDYQHNDVMRRMIANGTDADNTIHVTWMNLPSPPIGEERYVDYNSYSLGSWLATGGMHVTLDGQRGGYTGLDLLPDQREVLCYHRTQPDPPPLFWGTTISIETGSPGDGTFESYDIPDSVNLSALKGIWPTVACAKVTSSPSYIHITSAEGQTSGSADKAMYYVRCYRNDVSGKLICQSPGWTDSLIVTKETKLGPNRVCYQYDKCRLGTGVIATSPVSQKVAIVYYRNYASSQTQNELMYMESSTNGSDWIANPATMTATPITSYEAAGGVDRGYDDLAAIYDYNNNLHIVWTTFKSTNSNDVTLWHWTASQGARKAGFTTATSAVDPGAWNLLLAKFNLGIYHPTTDTTILYLTYTKFQDGDISAGKFANGDIYAKGSLNSGLTWGPEVNLTGTNSNNCAAGTCKSEHWSSLAERVDNFLHISYIHDLDPAGFSTPEGTGQNDSVIYMKYARFPITKVASMTYDPAEMITPPKWAIKNGNKPDSMKFDNVGTADLYVQMSGPAYVTINPNQFPILEGGLTQTVNLTFNAPAVDTYLVDSLRILSNHGVVGGGAVYNDTQWVKFHFVGTDTFYFAEYDTCTKGVKLVISNVGNLGNQADSNMLNYNNHDYLFDFSPAFVTDYPVIGKLGSTWVHEHHNYFAQDTIRVLEAPSLNTIAFCTYTSPIANTEAYPYHHAWFGWIKHSRILQFEYGNLHAVVIKNTWKWKAPPKWWPDVAVTAPTGGYFGVVGDWDVPAEGAQKNLGDFDQSKNLIWQTSDSTGFTNYFGGVLFLGASVKQGGNTTNYTAPYGAHILMNRTTLYPDGGYDNDTLYKYMSQAGWSKEMNDSSQDLNIVMSFVPQVTSPDTSTIITEEYALLVTGQGQADFFDAAAKIKGVKCGDANLDGKVSVSDVVYLINYLFKGGSAPWTYYADANGDCKISVSDVVYLINYLFKGGLAPHCADCLNCP
ncbi:MAG: dockerin type I repeat-containing protein [candidate division Zixibacteria bacterium]|nr:dockerin type I repeat-containing protein [candidate division Zixibacteria bacterium]